MPGRIGLDTRDVVHMRELGASVLVESALCGLGHAISVRDPFGHSFISHSYRSGIKDFRAERQGVNIKPRTSMQDGPGPVSA
jgi:hypothetical protein